jgi:hypothetical protein
MEETYNSLSKEEKAQVIRSHIKNLELTKYNIQLSILAEQSIDVPSETTIMSYQMQLDDAGDKQQALQAELLRVESEPVV